MDGSQLAKDFVIVQEGVEACRRNEAGATARLANQLEIMKRNLEGPGLHLARIRFQTGLNMCNLISIETGLLNALVGHAPEPATAAQLATEIMQDEVFTSRILRVLSANGICTEVGLSTYLANNCSHELSTPSQSGATRMIVNNLFPIGAQLTSQLRTTGIQQFADESGDMTPWLSTYGISMYEYFKKNPENGKNFDDYMMGKNSYHSIPWFHHYPLSDELRQDLETGSLVIVDIGGGTASDMIGFKQEYTGKTGRVVVEDLPRAIANVDRDQLPQDIELLPYDFFGADQPIKGAKIYYMHNIIHNWSDKKAEYILSKTVEAMKKDYSILLLHEMVLPESACSWRNATIDFSMMVFNGGIERTKQQWQRLLDAAGLYIKNVWLEGSSSESIIEAHLMD